MYSFDNSKVSKWDTIQADVADAYTYLDEDTVEEEEEDFFGFSKSIETEHLTDEQVDEILAMFGEDY
jgi:hypothetical protein